MPSQRPASTSASTRPVALASSLAKQAPFSPEHLDDLGDGPARGHGRGRLAAVGGQQPGQVGSQHERHRGGAGGAGQASIGVVGCRGPQAQPGDLALVAEPIEPRGVVVADAAGQHQRLPRADRGLVALQLSDHAGQAVGAAVLGGAGDVLPLQPGSA